MSVKYIRNINQYIDFDMYDHVCIFFSGGKDSVDCVLQVLENGVVPEKIILMHNLIDGREGDGFFMDWQCTEAYCQAFADALGIKLEFSWKSGGFLGEMLRDNSHTGNKVVTDVNGELITVESSTNPKYKNTRLMYPQKSADLSVRYCSTYLKIDIGDLAVRRRFDFENGKKVLVLSGERAQESPARAKYLSFEKYRADNRDGKRVPRFIDHLRIAHQDSEKEVWDRMKNWKIQPHPAYIVGLGRTSCKFCVFANPSQWATMREYDPVGFQRILSYEKQFNHSIDRGGSFIDKIADTGEILQVPKGAFDIANSTEYKLPIITNTWELPLGAFRGTGGAV